MNIASKIQREVGDEVRRIIHREGFELFGFKILCSQGRSTVRCLIDYPQGGVTVEQCARVNKRIFSFLEERRILSDNFVIEVNSPGLDRPLRNRRDFARSKGKVISLWLNEPVAGKKYLEGELIGLNQQSLCLKIKDKIAEITYEKIKVGKEKAG